ncbi:MAG: hypothetical protein K6T90_05010 [Leptolyngbyaceae cyanobacterium HOT.MB2.61]|nr:hypothetical protein [Leptolyngbyaceae cyanobacterium HOT.MB2.61]
MGTIHQAQIVASEKDLLEAMKTSSAELLDKLLHIDGKFRYLRVWKLFGDNWKVIAGSVVASQT